MATIPVYDLPTQELAGFQLNEFKAPNVQPVENFAGRQMIESGRAITQAGMVAMKIADEFNDAKTKEVDMLFADKVREKLYDPKEGYMNSVGKSALDRQKDTEKALVEARTEVEKSLENDTQRGMFKSIADRRMLAVKADIDRHALQQLKVYNVAESKARVDNLAEDAAVNAKSWAIKGGQFQMYHASMKSEIDNLAVQAGIAKTDGTADTESAQYKEMQRAYTTKLHTNVIGQFIAEENPGAAAAYLKAYKGEVDASQLDNLTRAVKSASETVGVKDTSLRLSMEIKGTLPEQIAAVDAMFKDGKINASLRDATVARFEHDNATRRQGKAEWESGLLGSAQDWLMKNPGKSVMDMPTGLYNNLKNSGHLGSIVGFAKNGRYVTDPKAAAEVMTMPDAQLAQMSPQEFYAKYRGSLDDGDLQLGMARVNNARGTAKTEHLEIISTNDRVESTAKTLKILPDNGKPSGEQQKNYDSFRKTVNDRIYVYEQNVLGGKRKANNEELQGILDNVIKDKAVVNKTLWFDSAKPVSTMTEDELKSAYVRVGNEDVTLASIPATQRKTIIQKLNSRRIPVTEQAIADLWVQAGKPR